MFLEIQLAKSAPSLWGKAQIVPVPKKGTSEVRPISILPRLSRLYTVILSKRLYKWTELNGIIPVTQNGFRPGHCTLDNVFVLQCLIRRSCFQGGNLYVVMADLRKAFDLVCRDLMFGFLMAAGAWGSHMDLLRGLYQQSSATLKI